MRIGVVGAGKIGSMRVQTVKENSETELAAVLDINPALAEQAVAGLRARVDRAQRIPRVTNGCRRRLDAATPP